MKHFLIVLTVTTFSLHLFSQSPEDSVKALINDFFAGMKTSDGQKLKNTFADSIIFQTIGYNKEGVMLVKNESPGMFIKQVSNAKPGSLDERIVFETIKIDGPLAVVWTPYKFYYNGTFSHCGVNSFQLVRLNGLWKVQYIIDTRRKERCIE